MGYGDGKSIAELSQGPSSDENRQEFANVWEVLADTPSIKVQLYVAEQSSPGRGGPAGSAQI